MIKRVIKAMYIKWILGQCKHLCCLCKYKNECWDNLEVKYGKIYKSV